MAGGGTRTRESMRTGIAAPFIYQVIYNKYSLSICYIYFLKVGYFIDPRITDEMRTLRLDK
jgi:hypothetical protein